MSQKRAHEEYHDPDYPVASTSTDPPHDAKRARPSSPDSGARIATTTTTTNSATGSMTPAHRADHIRRIVRREFAHELNEREQELNCIEHRLQQAKRLLQRVRYAVVYSFYTNKRLVYTESELRNELTVVSMTEGAAEETVVDPSELEPSQPSSAATAAADAVDAPTQQSSSLASQSAAQQPPQNAVHPSLKKLLGTTTIDYNEILKVRPARQAAKDAKTSISEKLRTKKDERRLRLAAAAISPMQAALRDTTTPAPDETTTAAVSAAPKVPRYVSPIKSAAPIPHVTTMRAGAMRNATRHLVAVGNTSKYIGDDSGDPSGSQAGGVTHKWLVYVKCKQPTTATTTTSPGGGIERMVQKVRFFLHPSYKPNDVVDVCSAPFQIARRGWGEFPVRVQLWFHAHVQQKPLQIIHQLVLDKKLTGLQTMGAETVVEMWLNLPAEVVKQEPTAVVMTNGQSKLAPTPLKLERAPVVAAPIAPEDIPLEQTVLGTEPCWDPDGLINNVKISPAEQNSLLAMAEESKRFAAEHCMPTTPTKPLATQPPATISNSTAPAIVNGNASKPMPQTTIVIKQEPNAVTSTPSTPSTSAVVVKTEPPSKVSITLAPIVAAKTAPPLRKFVKCLNAAGKVVMVELQTDPNNPKNIRLIRNSTLNASALPANVSAATIAKPATAPVASPSTVPPKLTVGVPPKPMVTIPSRLLVVPKAATAPQAATNSAPTITIPVQQPTIQISSPPAQPIKMQPPSAVSASATPPPSATPPSTSSSPSPSTLPSTKKVIMRNGQMFIIDTSQFVSRPIPQICPPTASTSPNPTPTPQRPVTIAAPKPKQQSLLKPQISLLKPKLTKTLPPPGTVAQPPTTTLPAKIPPQTVPLKFAIKLPIAAGQTRPVGLMPLVRRTIVRPTPTSSLMRANPAAGIAFGQQQRLISLGSPRRPPLSAIVLPPEKSLFHSASAAAAGGSSSTASNNRLIIQRHDYRRELQHRFVSRAPFASERAAIEFLLRQVPQVHRFAGTNPDYAQAFPFVCDSERAFDEFLWPKQRSVEWTRAKFIGRMLEKWRPASETSAAGEQQQKSAPIRWTTREIVLFARLFGYALPVRPVDGQGGEKIATDPTTAAITSLIKREIKRVERTHEPTMTTSVRITSWMDAWHARRNRRRKPATTVDDEIVDVTGDDDAEGGAAMGGKQKRGKGETSDGKRTRPNSIYPLPAALRTEAGWVEDVCSEVQVKLKPEEIVEDVLHPSAQLVLVTALHSFIGDLLHRAYASKSETVRSSTNATDHIVGVEDLRNSIVATPHFDFLTNRHLGGTSSTDSTIKQERP